MVTAAAPPGGGGLGHFVPRLRPPGRSITQREEDAGWGSSGSLGVSQRPLHSGPTARDTHPAPPACCSRQGAGEAAPSTDPLPRITFLTGPKTPGKPVTPWQEDGDGWPLQKGAGGREALPEPGSPCTLVSPVLAISPVGTTSPPRGLQARRNQLRGQAEPQRAEEGSRSTRDPLLHCQ